ncbi:MAG: TolB family protein [Calditrichia bacterium]
MHYSGEINFSGELNLLDPFSGNTKKLGGVFATARKAVFSPNGEFVLAINTSRPSTSSPLYVSEPSGENPVVVPGSEGVSLANFSSDGNYVAFLNLYQLSIHNRTTGETNLIELGTLDPDIFDLPAWFPDRNTFVVLVTESPSSSLPFFIEYDPATKTYEQISDSLTSCSEISTSPDGRFLMYVSRSRLNSETRYAIQRLNISERQPQVLLDCGKRRIFNIAISPNGEWISFLHETKKGYRYYELFLMRSDGTELRQLTDLTSDLEQPVWRPDSEGIAYLSQFELAGRKIYYYNLNTGRNSVLLNATYIDFQTWVPLITEGF